MMYHNTGFRVLFVSINNTWRYGNIGMDQLLGYLRRQGFDIDISYYRHRQKTAEIDDSIAKSGIYNVYGFSVNNSNYEMCCTLAGQIKQRDSKAIIVFGGGYPTRYYREILGEDAPYRYVIDYLILGDGEAPMEYLLGALRNRVLHGDVIQISHRSIASLGDIDGKKEFFNTKIDWWPAFDYFEKDDRNINSRKIFCIQIKNNICTGNCSFCTERHGKVVYKDIADVVSQIKYVHEKFNVKKIFFTDDNILDPNNDMAKAHLKKLCEEIKKLNLKVAFQCYIKALSLRDKPEDHSLLQLMYDVGFREIFIGVEAGNQDDLNLYNKYTTVEQNKNIIRLIREHNIFPIIGFIAYNPYSTKERIKENFQYLCDIECTYLHNYLYSFVVINKYTMLYETTKRDGLLCGDDKAYLDIGYCYKNRDVIDVLDYVRKEMVPLLRNLDYELDWIIYSMMEHEIWYDDIRDYRKILLAKKKEDAAWIRDKLSFLFVDFDVERFKTVAEEFWRFFHEEEKLLKEIYDYYISLHYDDTENVKCNADEKRVLNM